MSNDQNLGEVTYTRIYDAPRDLVFECMITPEHLTHFWGPVGVSTPIGNITVDPRPGGVFETVMVNDATGEEYPTRGVFVEVTKPEKIVWTEPDVEGGMTTTSHVPRPRRRPHRGRRPPDQRARDVPHPRGAGRHAEQLRPLRRLPGDVEVAPNHDLSGARQESGPAESHAYPAAMTRRAGIIVVALAIAFVVMSTTRVSAADAAKDASGSFARSVDIGGGRRIYVTCRGTRAPGDPTIVLMSGYHDSSDVWTRSDVLNLLKPAAGPAVFPALAASPCVRVRPAGHAALRRGDATHDAQHTRHATPDRHSRREGAARDTEGSAHPGTVRAGRPLARRAHGAAVRAHLSRADQGDRLRRRTFSPTIPTLFGPLWPLYRDGLLNPPAADMPLPSMRTPESERIDLDTSARQVLSAPPLPAMPVVVLTKTESFAGLDQVPAGITADEINSLYGQAQRYFVDLAPTTPQEFATGSDHYIQFSQPDLIVRATELVLDRVRGRD